MRIMQNGGVVDSHGSMFEPEDEWSAISATASVASALGPFGWSEQSYFGDELAVDPLRVVHEAAARASECQVLEAAANLDNTLDGRTGSAFGAARPDTLSFGQSVVVRGRLVDGRPQHRAALS
jgi:hypothetical protein